MQTIYFAGGCLWGVQAFVKTLPGVVATEAGRANGATGSLEGPYDGYAECVRTTFDEGRVTVTELMGYFFEIIDPYSVNQQGATSARSTAPASTARTHPTCARRRPTSGRDPTATGSASRCCRLPAMSRAPRSTKTTWTSSLTTTAISPGSS